MSTARLARNVEAYEPEADPANIDPEALQALGWPATLIECVRRQRIGSTILQNFELRRLGRPQNE
jgi:hypothetical protein